MPFYELECTCGNEKEVLLSISKYEKEKETPTIKCDCGELMKFKISKSGSFVLKGSGWFSDGYSKGNK